MGPLAVVVLLGLGVTAAADDTTQPVITQMKVSPAQVCRKHSSTCKHPGATVSFTVSEFSQVVAGTRPLDTHLGADKVFKKKFPGGANSRHFSVKGLPTGRYLLQLTAVDPSGNRSDPKERTYKIVP